jgi:hypothetical protein
MKLTDNFSLIEFKSKDGAEYASKAITLRLYPNGKVKYTAFDGMEYPAYWKEQEKVWKYVKNGNSYVIFTKE